MTLEEFAGRIEEARSKQFNGGPCYKGRCPSCAAMGHDKDCSHFVVWEGADEWLHVKCIKGCSEDQILAAMGLTVDARRVKPYEPSVGAEQLPIHVYELIGGGYGAEKHRKVKDGKKYCVWKVRFKDGIPLPKVEHKIERGPRKGETFVDYPTPEMAGLNGELDVLYRFQDVRRAIDRGETIYIGEGEPATEAAKKKGICHTCQRAGAGPNKWLQAYTAQLRGAKEIVIVADRDSEGEKYSIEVFQLLRSSGFNVRVVRSKTVREHDDLRDHLEAGFGVDELIPAPDLMPPRGLVTVPVETYTVEDPSFLFGTYLRRAQINIVDGDGGIGKSTFVWALAAAASNGYDPLAKAAIKPFRTLYFGNEDEGGDVRYIYEKIGGKPGFLEHYSSPFNFSPANLALLKDTIIDGKFEMVIFDVLAYFMNGLVKDLNNAVDLQGPLENLRNVAMQTRCGIVNLRHIGKSKDGKPVSDLGIGSVQIRNSHRSQLVMQWHPDRENHKKCRVVSHEKGSARVEKGDPFGWSYEGGEFGWIDVEPDVFDEQKDPNSKGKREMCEKWLQTNLTGMWMESKVMFDTLTAYGVSKRTIETACKKLDVKYRKDSAGKWWKTIEQKDPFPD